MKTKNLLNERFRVSPLYTLREWNMLSQGEKELLSGLHDEEEVYGIFSPVETASQLSIKIAYREVALLYLHLSHTDSLPRYLTVLRENSFHQTISQLILDQ